MSDRTYTVDLTANQVYALGQILEFVGPDLETDEDVEMVDSILTALLRAVVR